MNRLLKSHAIGMLGLIFILSLLGEPAFAQKKGGMADEATRRSEEAAGISAVTRFARSVPYL